MRGNSSNLKVRQGLETADKLLRIARRSFSTKGYAATRTSDIIAKAKVTKGALYHHFPSKEDLFEAVYRSVEAELAERIHAAAAAADDPWEQLLRGCFAYLEACSEHNLQQILRIDGPAVLGRDKWARIDREYGVDRLIPTLQNLSDLGIISVPSVEAFAWQLSGAMNDATFWIAQHDDAAVAVRESKKTLQLMLRGARSDIQ